jgi:hypothetical protein
VRAYDEAGNVGTASATFRAPTAPGAPARAITAPPARRQR